MYDPKSQQNRQNSQNPQKPQKPQKPQNPMDALIKAFASLPGLGPRSARRVALQLLTNKDKMLRPLLDALATAQDKIVDCNECGNLDAVDPCRICQNPKRSSATFCIIEDVADLWAIERTSAFQGQYHILGGVLSALDGIGPDDLSIPKLMGRLHEHQPQEIILALSATVDGQTTAHFITDKIRDAGLDANITRLAHGVPVGGELDYLDDSTITTALKSRSTVS